MRLVKQEEGTIMKPKHSLARLVHLIPVTLGILALLGYFSIWALPASAQAQSPSFVRIIHASPDVGTADVRAGIRL